MLCQFQVWRDLKSRACTKAARLNRERNATGNRTVTSAPLTKVEKRIISILGSSYVTGTDCPDSMPEENVSSYFIIHYHICLFLIFIFVYHVDLILTACTTAIGGRGRN